MTVITSASALYVDRAVHESERGVSRAVRTTVRSVTRQCQG